MRSYDLIDRFLGFLGPSVLILQLLVWLALLVVVVLSLWPAGLNGLRIGIESIASVTKRISMFLAWFVFVVHNVTHDRYGLV